MTLPIRAISNTNAREHWRVRQRRSKEQKRAVAIAWAALRPKIALPVIVVLTRFGLREMDTDNLAESCKAIRDQLATQLGVDDGDKRITWRYQQALAKEYAVQIEIVEMIELSEPKGAA